MNKPPYTLTKLEAICRDDHEFMQKMLQMFCTDTPAVVAEIREAHDSEDYKKVEYLAHRIKPSVDLMGLQIQLEEVRRIEELAGSGTKSPELNELIIKFEQGINGAVEHIQETYLTDNELG